MCLRNLGLHLSIVTHIVILDAVHLIVLTDDTLQKVVDWSLLCYHPLNLNWFKIS